MKGNEAAIYIKPANVVGAEQELWRPNDSFVYSIDWTSDGRFLIFTELLSSTGKSRIAKLPTAGNAEPCTGSRGIRHELRIRPSLARWQMDRLSLGRVRNG